MKRCGSGSLFGLWGLSAMTVVIVSALTACDADEPESTEQTFAGLVPGTDMAIAVALENDAVMAYVCGGATTYATHTRWFAGELLADGTFVLARADGWSIAGDRSGEGTLTGPAGQTYRFSPAAAEAPTGLYRGLEGPCPTGLVVWADGDQLASQGVWCDGAGRYGQVTPIAPMTYDRTGAVAVARWPEDLQMLAPVSPSP